MEQEHTKSTSNWQEFWQILRHGQFGKLFAGATENTLIQFFRYCFVGGAATVVDWGISALLFFAVFDQHYAILANGCSFVAGLLANYFLSTFWVFRSSKVQSRLVEFLAFAAIGVVGLLLTIGITKVSEITLGNITSAYQMIGKTPDYIEVIRPLSGGVISDDRMTQYMIREFILQVTGHRLTKPRIIICVPSFITDVEKRAVVEAAMSAGSRKAYLIDEPIAALIGAGVNIGKARGNMVVDIGGGTTDVAIVSMNGIVTSHSVRAAGNTLDQAIIRYMQTKYKLLIGERTAERLKIEMTNLYDPRADVTSWVKGRNLVSGLPEMQEISELEIFEAVEDVIADIIEAIKTVLEETPPELVGDIYENGVLMAGGGAMLGGLRKLVERTLQVKCVVAKDAIHCVAKGTAIAFRKMDTLLDGFENIAVYQFK